MSRSPLILTNKFIGHLLGKNQTRILLLFSANQSAAGSEVYLANGPKVRDHDLLIDQTGGEQIQYRGENKKWRHLTLAGN